MPKYYFNVMDGVTYHDAEGEYLLDLDGAKQYARKMVRELKRNQSDTRRWHDWKVTVCNDSGNVVYEVSFEDVVA